MNNKSKIIIYEKEILEKTKEFLKKITKMNPRSIMLQLEEEIDKHGGTIAYEKENFIIVLPNGNTSEAKLYGNWDEALSFAQRILTKGTRLQKNARIVLAEYTLENS